MLKKEKNYIIILMYLGFMFGCSANSNSTLTGSQKKSDSQSKDDQAAKQDSKQSNEGQSNFEENSKVTPPQAIAGAFLTCDTIDPANTKFKPDDTNEVLGCALVRDNKKVDTAAYKTTLSFNDGQTGNAIAFLTDVAPTDSKWHHYGSISKDKLPIAEAKLILVGILTGDRSLFTFKTGKLRARTQVGTGPGIAPPGLNLNAPAKWNMASGSGAYHEGLIPQSICQSGIPLSKVDSATYSKFGSLSNLFFDTNIVAGNHSLAQDCLVKIKKFDANWVQLGSDAFAIEGAGCIFLRSISDVFIFDANSQKNDPNINVAKLEDLAKNSACGY